jgi:hypothetical protein
LLALQKQQLLSLDVPALFIQVALDEGPGLSIRYQYPELGKLHAVVSCLIRSCYVSSRWQSSAVSILTFMHQLVSHSKISKRTKLNLMGRGGSL